MSHAASQVKTVPQLSVMVPEQRLPHGLPVETHVGGGVTTAASFSAPELSQARMSFFAASFGTRLSSGIGPFGLIQRSGEFAGSPSFEPAGLLRSISPRLMSS